MKPTIVYSVVCNDNNWYLEQLQLSLYSLKETNPDAGIVIVCDIESKEYVSSRLEGSGIQIIAVSCPDWMNPMCKSRYLKVNLRNIIPGDFLYIDNDTVILEPLDGLDAIIQDIAAVPDNHHGTRVQDQRLFYMLKTRTVLRNTKSIQFNSGVMYVKDTPVARRLFREWAEVWKRFAAQGFFFDQLALNEVLSGKKNSKIMFELPGEWNCQITRDSSAEYKTKAKIVHYQCSCIQFHFDLDFDSIYREIRDSGRIPERVRKLISDKTFSQIRCTIETSGLSATYFESPLRILFHFNRRFFNFLEWISIKYIAFTLSPLGKIVGKIKTAL